MKPFTPRYVRTPCRVGIRFLTSTPISLSFFFFGNCYRESKGPHSHLSLPKALSSYSTWILPYSKQVHHFCQLDCRRSEGRDSQGLVNLLCAHRAARWVDWAGAQEGPYLWMVNEICSQCLLLPFVMAARRQEGAWAWNEVAETSVFRPSQSLLLSSVPEPSSLGRTRSKLYQVGDFRTCPLCLKPMQRREPTCLLAFYLPYIWHTHIESFSHEELHHEDRKLLKTERAGWSDKDIILNAFHKYVDAEKNVSVRCF